MEGLKYGSGFTHLVAELSNTHGLTLSLQEILEP
jgi:hypothetical protein